MASKSGQLRWVFFKKEKNEETKSEPRASEAKNERACIVKYKGSSLAGAIRAFMMSWKTCSTAVESTERAFDEHDN